MLARKLKIAKLELGLIEFQTKDTMTNNIPLFLKLVPVYGALLWGCSSDPGSLESDATTEAGPDAIVWPSSDARPEGAVDGSADSSDARATDSSDASVSDAAAEAEMPEMCSGPSSSTALRVLSFNVQRAKDFSLDDIANVINTINPDVVGLQEIDVGTVRSSGVDQLAELKKLTGLEGAFGKAIDYDGGEYGVAMLSRYPPSAITLNALPGEGEQRVLLQANISAGDKVWSIGVTHLGLTETARLEQVAEIEQLMRGKQNRILMGDMNFKPQSAPYKALSEWVSDAWDSELNPGNTSPAAFPINRIDYVFADDQLLPAVCEVVWPVVVSDHRAVVVSLGL